MEENTAAMSENRGGRCPGLEAGATLWPPLLVLAKDTEGKAAGSCPEPKQPLHILACPVLVLCSPSALHSCW